MKLYEFTKICDEEAKKERELYGAPPLELYNISKENGVKLAKKLGANVDLVKCGVALMDIKLGEAKKLNRQKEHVLMSADYTKELLKKYDINEADSKVILHSVLAHHGTIPYENLEAEIVANADCYRFITPNGVMHFFSNLIKSGKDYNEAIDNTLYKLEEKHSIMSLDEAKKDLEEYYMYFKKILESAKD